jgi:hypothetical protein
VIHGSLVAVLAMISSLSIFSDHAGFATTS